MTFEEMVGEEVANRQGVIEACAGDLGQRRYAKVGQLAPESVQPRAERLAVISREGTLDLVRFEGLFPDQLKGTILNDRELPETPFEALRLAHDESVCDEHFWIHGLWTAHVTFGDATRHRRARAAFLYLYDLE
jgi:hypothetical protein